MDRRLEKLFKEVKKNIDSGTLKPFSTLAELNAFKCCFNELVRTGKTYFLQKELKEVFSKHGIDVKEYGIGYKVVL